jgi:hypothetical protein
VVVIEDVFYRCSRAEEEIEVCSRIYGGVVTVEALVRVSQNPASHRMTEVDIPAPSTPVPITWRGAE